MKITQDFIPAGRRNRPGRVNPMLFVTVHETGNTSKGAGARNHANYLKGDAAANTPVSWHYTVDDTDIYQHLPENEDGFHAGDNTGNGNRQSIGIEICVNSDGDFRKAVNLTVELVADICKRRNIAVSNVVQHNNWSGKNCPQNIRSGNPVTWAKFIELVREKLNVQPPKSQPETARQTADIILELVKPDAVKNKIFPSVKAAQLILESDYGRSALAVEANNVYGMKKVLSGNAWNGSAWDGKSVYQTISKEMDAYGNTRNVLSEFRKYAKISDSIADHSAYLLGAKNGSVLRFANLTNAKDYKAQIAIIKNGGYATDVNYVKKVCDIIEKFKLDKYDGGVNMSTQNITVTIGATKYIVDGKPFPRETMVYKDEAWLPAAEIFKFMGASAVWDAKTNTTTVSLKK